MILINKKRITLIIICVFLGLFSFSFQIAGKEENEEQTVQTTATPASNKTIILDAGHGSPDERCRKQ